MHLHNKKYKRNTVARKLSSLRSFYRFLFNNDVIDSNPFKYVKTPKKEKRLPKYVGAQDLETIFNTPCINTSLGQRDKLILEILYATGMRVGELVKIKISDIDFSKKRERLTEVEDAISEFVAYFYGWKDGMANTVRRCEKELRDFRFESQLSTWLNSACKNFFLRQIQKSRFRRK